MASWVDGFFKESANVIRDMVLSREEKTERIELQINLELVKLASVVTTLASVLFFGSNPCAFTFTLSLIVGVLARDVIQISNNVLEICNDARIEAIVENNHSALTNQFSKNLWILGSLIRIGTLDLKRPQN